LKNTSLLLLFLFGFFYLKAQQNDIEIQGFVIDQVSSQPIPFATIVVGDPSTQAPITGVTTADDGSFAVIAPSGAVYLEISFIGYETIRLEDFEVRGNRVDLGQIFLNEQSQMLGEVEVRG